MMLKVLKACLHELGKAQLGAGGFSITVSRRARSPYALRNVKCFKSPDMKKLLPKCFETQLRASSSSDFWEWVAKK